MSVFNLLAGKDKPLHLDLPFVEFIIGEIDVVELQGGKTSRENIGVRDEGEKKKRKESREGEREVRKDNRNLGREKEEAGK